MKRKTVFGMMLFLVGCLLMDGCASTTSTKGAYPTLKQTRMMVEPKMDRFRNAVAFGSVSLGERQRVDEAYSSYQRAFEAAVKAADSNYEATTPENVKALANQVITAIESISY